MSLSSELECKKQNNSNKENLRKKERERGKMRISENGWSNRPKWVMKRFIHARSTFYFFLLTPLRLLVSAAAAPSSDFLFVCLFVYEQLGDDLTLTLATRHSAMIALILLSFALFSLLLPFTIIYYLLGTLFRFWKLEKHTVNEADWLTLFNLIQHRILRSSLILFFNLAHNLISTVIIQQWPTLFVCSFGQVSRWLLNEVIGAHIKPYRPLSMTRSYCFICFTIWPYCLKYCCLCSVVCIHATK